MEENTWFGICDNLLGMRMDSVGFIRNNSFAICVTEKEIFFNRFVGGETKSLRKC